MSKADIIVGIQWGDEGKGKVVDKLCENYDFALRLIAVLALKKCLRQERKLL